jgi:glutamate-5-semialdehyde dehydrogenase
MLLPALTAASVTVHGDPVVQAYDPAVVAANDTDWAEEYLALDVAVRVVSSLEESLEHIRTWSSGHTEAIVTRSLEASHRFIAGCDSAAVMVNASTRFTDGEQLGMGAEVGISTQKLHARGPMGLPELTSTKWVVIGNGHIRE